MPERLAAGEVVAYVLLDLTIILAAARLVGAVFVRFGQPRVVGEIIAGILIGPTVLGGELSRGAVDATATAPTAGSGLVDMLYPLQAFAFLNLIGVLAMLLFMFVLGLEVEQRFLRGRGGQIAVVSVAVVVVPVLLGFVVAAILDTPGTWKVADATATTHGLFLGAGLAVTASAVLARILQEKRMLDTDLGAVGVGAGVAVTPLFFIVLAAAAASAQGAGVPSTVAVKLGLTALLLAVLFGAVRPAMGWVLKRRFHPEKPLDGDLLALMLFGALLTGLAADRIGIHSMSGGFLFGAAIPQVAGLGRAVSDRLQTFVVLFLVPVFLAVSGLQTDLRILEPSMLGGIALFLVTMVAAKWGAGALAGRAVGLGWQEANAIGVLMNCRGLAILIVALIGRQLGVITDPMQIAFVVGAIVTTMMTGPLVSRFVADDEVEAKRSETLGKSMAGFPAMTGGPRLLLVPGEPASESRVAEAALAHLDPDGPRAQFLVAHLPPPRPAGDLIGIDGGVGDAEQVVRETEGWLKPLAARLGAEGADADIACFVSPDPTDDLVQLAADWAATGAIVADPTAARAIEESGLPVERVGIAVEDRGSSRPGMRVPA
ncbi:MAG: cation:proton antiporter [Solirubrobacterales bacterium]